MQDFASKHKDRINSDPEFRHQFHVMCKSIGVDPLASNKGFWSDLLGVGDFYYELGVQIIQICLATRHVNGGIISLSELRDRIRNSKSRSRQNTSDDDIKRAVEKLSVLGSGFQIIEVWSYLCVWWYVIGCRENYCRVCSAWIKQRPPGDL